MPGLRFHSGSSAFCIELGIGNIVIGNTYSMATLDKTFTRRDQIRRLTAKDYVLLETGLRF